jgi:cell division protein ZapA
VTNDPRAQATPVTIFGRTYHLRGNVDPDYLHELAGKVDRAMHEVARTTGTADTLKVAILTALNLADECLQARTHAGGLPDGETDARLARMVSLLDEVLAS